MSDLISREAALKEICMDCHKPLPQYPEHGCPDPCYVYGGISNLPAVDAVEVVRCKQCIFRSYSDSSNSYYCKKWDVDDYEEAFVEENDFCSKGKKEIDNG